MAMGLHEHLQEGLEEEDRDEEDFGDFDAFWVTYAG